MVREAFSMRAINFSYRKTPYTVILVKIKKLEKIAKFVREGA
jgi:hypothetical protein